MVSETQAENAGLGTQKPSSLPEEAGVPEWQGMAEQEWQVKCRQVRWHPVQQVQAGRQEEQSSE